MKERARRRLVGGGLLTAISMVAALAALPAASQPGPPGAPEDEPPAVEVSPAARHDVLPSLRGMLRKPGPVNHSEGVRPLRVFPAMDGPGQPADPVVQSSAPIPAAPALLDSIDGVGVGLGAFQPQYAPPDTVGAVGKGHYLHMTNVSFAIFVKDTKALLWGPTENNTIFDGFGGPCEDRNDGDPIVIYDRLAERWVFSQFTAARSGPDNLYYECVAVSSTSDPLDAWYRYAFAYSSFPDYPKLGTWPDGYYVSFNMFGGTFQGAKVCAYERDKMLLGQEARQVCFQLSTSFHSLLPADLDGSTPPPAGAPQIFVARTGSSLSYWKLKVDWANPGLSTLSTRQSIAGVSGYTMACNGGSCIPQKGTRQTLDSLGDRLMNRLAYRNFGTHESLVVNHSVHVPGTNPKNASTGIRWYELRLSGSGPVMVHQQGTYAPDATHRWMGSIAQDKQGNIAVGYSTSSSQIHPGIRYTGRLEGDPLGTLQAETRIIDGGGSQQRGLSRWGDYAAMSVDPVDDCTFWFTTQYLKTDGTWNWSTRIASFKFPGCL